MVKDAENCVADDKIMCSTPQKQKAIAVPSLHFSGIISSLQILIGEENVVLMSVIIDFANTPLPFFSVMALHFQLGENA